MVGESKILGTMGSRTLHYNYGEYKLELESATGVLYRGEKLLFKGFSYEAIRWFISASGNNPKIRDKFRNQLKMRQELTFDRRRDKEKWDKKEAKKK